MKSTLVCGIVAAVLVSLGLLGPRAFRQTHNVAGAGSAAGTTASEVEFKRYLETTGWKFQSEGSTSPTVKNTSYLKSIGDCDLSVRFDWGSDGVRALEMAIVGPPNSPNRSLSIHVCLVVGGAISREIQEELSRAIDAVELPGGSAAPADVTKDGWRVGYTRTIDGGVERLRMTARKVATGQ